MYIVDMKKNFLWKLIVTVVGAVIVVIGLSVYGPGQPADQEVSESQALSAEEQALVDTQQAAVENSTKALRYAHPDLDFSFEKPAGYTVGSLWDGELETLIVQKGSAIEESFQILISPLAEPIDLTPSLIKSELPGIAVVNPKKITLDGEARGLMFTSNNEGFGGKSFEIWFSTETEVYQITSYAAFAQQLQNIIGTWTFD